MAAKKLGKGEGPKAYFVWTVGYNKRTKVVRPLPKEPGPFGPHCFWNAKTFARIAATKGKHDRAVTLGWDITDPSFKIVRVYEGRTGIKLHEA